MFNFFWHNNLIANFLCDTKLLLCLYYSYLWDFREDRPHLRLKEWEIRIEHLNISMKHIRSTKVQNKKRRDKTPRNRWPNRNQTCVERHTTLVQEKSQVKSANHTNPKRLRSDGSTLWLSMKLYWRHFKQWATGCIWASRKLCLESSPLQGRLRVIQINLQHSKAATAVLQRLLEQKWANVTLIHVIH